MSVTMAVVRVVQVVVDQIVDMVAVRDRFMTTAGSVDVIDIMPFAGMAITAFRRVDISYLNCMLFDGPTLCRMMKMPFMQVINMAIMFYSRVTTLFSMGVFMIRMNVC